MMAYGMRASKGTPIVTSVFGYNINRQPNSYSPQRPGQSAAFTAYLALFCVVELGIELVAAPASESSDESVRRPSLARLHNAIGQRQRRQLATSLAHAAAAQLCDR